MSVIAPPLTICIFFYGPTTEGGFVLTLLLFPGSNTNILKDYASSPHKTTHGFLKINKIYCFCKIYRGTYLLTRNVCSALQWSNTGCCNIMYQKRIPGRKYGGHNHIPLPPHQKKIRKLDLSL